MSVFNKNYVSINEALKCDDFDDRNLCKRY